MLTVRKHILENLIEEHFIGHNKGDKNPQILKHFHEIDHIHLWKNNFKILDNNHKNDVKGKISEALYIGTM